MSRRPVTLGGGPTLSASSTLDQAGPRSASVAAPSVAAPSAGPHFYGLLDCCLPSPGPWRAVAPVSAVPAAATPSVVARAPTVNGGRVVRLEGAFNVRDLGGLETRDGLETRRGWVYRSDSLEWVTDADRAHLFGVRGIGTIIDLRTRAEAGGDGMVDARRFPTVKALSIPLIPDDRIDLEPFPAGNPIAVAHHYLGYLDDVGGPAVEILTEIARSVENGVPVLFHCAAGRDRTGVVAALLQMLLGVLEQETVRDYIESNRNAAEVSRRLMKNPLYHHNGSKPPVFLVERRTIRHFMRLVRERFGGVKEWAQSAGVGPSVRASLRENLVVSRVAT